MGKKIITIDEEKCTGCGGCISTCAEGALQLIDGKAKLVREDFCDGFGNCVGQCPVGALQVVEQASPPHAHVHSHSQTGSGCPSSRSIDFAVNASITSSNCPGSVVPSDLGQWPVQLHLVAPQASFFKNKELAVLSTCSPLAFPDVHWRFIRGRSVVVACPKLDQTGPYVEKLAAIFQETSIPRVHVLIMEVPCCRGLWVMVEAAWKLSARQDLVLEKHIISLKGSLLSSEIPGHGR